MSIRDLFNRTPFTHKKPVVPITPPGLIKTSPSTSAPFSFLSSISGLIGSVVKSNAPKPVSPAVPVASKFEILGDTQSRGWNGSITAPWTPERCKEIANVTGIVVRPTDGALAIDDIAWTLFIRNNGLTTQWQDTNNKIQNGTLRINRPTTGALAIDDMMWNVFLNSNGLYEQWKAQGYQSTSPATPGASKYEISSAALNSALSAAQEISSVLSDVQSRGWNGSITAPWTPERCKEIANVTGIVVRPTDGSTLAIDDIAWTLFIRDNGLTTQWQDTNNKIQNGTLRINRPTTGALAIDDMMWNVFLNSNGLYEQWKAQGYN